VDEQAGMCEKTQIGGIYDILQAKHRRERTNSTGEPLPVRDLRIIDIFNSLKDHFASHGLLDRKGHLRESSKSSPLLISS
jgi:hypothetical protein